MRLTRATTLAAILLILGLSSGSPAGEKSAFERMTTHYEGIRQSLLHDSTDGTAEAVARIQRLVEQLDADLDPGIRVDAEEEFRAILPLLRDATDGLAEAAKIAETREAFGALSKAMVRYRQLIADPVPVVAFCSMAQQVWLQPAGEIGNPYYGQSMARCGEIVSE